MKTHVLSRHGMQYESKGKSQGLNLYVLQQNTTGDQVFIRDPSSQAQDTVDKYEEIIRK